MRPPSGPIAVISPKPTGLIVTRRLVSAGFDVGAVITVSDDIADRTGNRDGVAAMRAASSFASAPFIRVTDYANPDFGAASHCRLALCIGWQRIVPEGRLAQFEHGIYGSHGSFKPLPHGRGRSPMNWALLLGRSTIFNTFFQYVAEVDTGPIYAVDPFPINKFDDEFSVTRKFAVSTANLAIEVLPSILDGSADPEPGLTSESFFPRRTPPDGEINWSWSTTDVLNHVRSHRATFSWTDGSEKIIIVRAQPWELSRGDPGAVLEVFSPDEFVVATGDGAVLVREAVYVDSALHVVPGDHFQSPFADVNAQTEVPW